MRVKGSLVETRFVLISSREQTGHSGPFYYKDRIQKCLELFPTVRGPLDLTSFLNNNDELPQLSDEELCDFISRYNALEALAMTQWIRVSDK